MFSVRNISCLLFVIVVAGIKNESTFCGQKVHGREHPYIYYEDNSRCIFNVESRYDKLSQARLEEICGYTSADGKRGYKLRLASFSDPVVYNRATSDIEEHMRREGEEGVYRIFTVGLHTSGPNLPFFCGNNEDEIAYMKSTWKWSDGAPMNINEWCHEDEDTYYQDCKALELRPKDRTGILLFSDDHKCFENYPTFVAGRYADPVCEYYKSANCDTEEIVRTCKGTGLDHPIFHPTCLDLENVQKCIIDRIVENCGSKSLAREECEQATKDIFERNPELGSMGCDRSANKCI